MLQTLRSETILLAMGNITAPLVTYYQSFADEILGKFRRISQLTPHALSNGTYHEEILRSVLRNFLTERFSVKTGFIYHEGRTSGQLDIMIFDENNPIAYLFKEGEFAIVIPEAVTAVIEVKSDIDTVSFDDSIEKIALVKSFIDIPAQLTGIVFSFDGGTSNDETLGKWLSSDLCKNYKDRKELAPETIIFLCVR